MAAAGTATAIIFGADGWAQSDACKKKAGKGETKEWGVFHEGWDVFGAEEFVYTGLTIEPEIRSRIFVKY